MVLLINNILYFFNKNNIYLNIYIIKNESKK